MDEAEIVRNIEDAGFVAMRRNMHYDVLGGPMCRQQAIPRRLALDVAKEDGAPLVPDELLGYSARSRGARASRSGAPAATSVRE
jgi:hypothetical protein